MKCRFCGCETFVGHQVVHMDVLVDGQSGDFAGDLPGGATNIYEAEKPFGPFQCCDCGAEYDKLTNDATALSGPTKTKM